MTAPAWIAAGVAKVKAWGWIAGLLAVVGFLLQALLRRRPRPAPPKQEVVETERAATKEAVKNAYEERERTRALPDDGARLNDAIKTYLREHPDAIARLRKPKPSRGRRADG